MRASDEGGPGSTDLQICSNTGMCIADASETTLMSYADENVSEILVPGEALPMAVCPAMLSYLLGMDVMWCTK